jgi:putative SOS response-associated peptidase YedK
MDTTFPDRAIQRRAETRAEIIRPTEHGWSMDKVRWGWSPFWAKGGGKRPDPINARVETVMTRKCFQAAMAERPGDRSGERLV